MWKATAAIAALFPCAVAAQELPPSDTRIVISQGAPLASLSLSEPFRPALPGMLPADTRMQEVFFANGGALYLCYLKGSTASGTPPYASCYGPPVSGG